MSDTTIDYPLAEDVFSLIATVQSKTISNNFDVQLDAAEELFGQQIKFSFTKHDVDDILATVEIYEKDVVERVRIILYQQMRKYPYMFT